MRQEDIVLVRVYCSEKGHKHQRIIDLLHRDHRVAGVTAFRGIAGFGRSGHIHEAGLLDVSLDLPVIVEIVDQPAKIEPFLGKLEALFEGRLRTAFRFLRR